MKRYELSMVSGAYDKGQTDDGREYKTDRSGDRTGGCADSAGKQKSGYWCAGKKQVPAGSFK